MEANTSDGTDDLVETLSTAEKKVLLALDERGGRASPDELMEATDLEQVKVMNASSWLQSKGLAAMEEDLESSYQVTGEGQRFLQEGLPEVQVLELVMDGTHRFSELRKQRDDLDIAIGWLMRKGWCTIDKKEGDRVLTPTEKGEKAVEGEQPEVMVLRRIAKGEAPGDPDMAETLVQRNALSENEEITRTVILSDTGKDVVKQGLEISEEIAQLTPEHIQSGSWRERSFRRYDVTSFAPVVHPGKRHPLSRLIERVRRIFVEMGFQEITGGYVEPCFWDMDVLFIPQDHPARDMQDTFYCSNPDTLPIDDELLEIVKMVHETGGDTGSTGWQYDFDSEQARRVVLRTHTTVNTIRYLAEHPEPPAKVFSIGRVFRRETIDSTHLPEFYQIEGIVHEEQANFRQLIGLLTEFYKKLGFDDIRLRPAYYPYTEPSMDVEVRWHGRWMELGGSGIFRPEVTEPLGVTEPVLAWGLGLERIAMELYGLHDIRQLYLSDIEWLRNAPML
ncbi:MAG: phenylalanine--tRNA ligase subunit alpha [Thermoplasmatota archaeon]